MNGVAWREAYIEIALKTIRRRIVQDERRLDEPRGNCLVVPDTDPAAEVNHFFLSWHSGFVSHGISAELTKGRQTTIRTRFIEAFRETVGTLAKSHRDDRKQELNNRQIYCT
ncbi:hypothetical protein [Caballeronia sp. SEWSISQ10-4 2]|uniref:hypothetical protein n=1 Tax=Caballeronia sp. SEWSISQ10-4 2 TaxID=2937438 RepID=UPI003461E442